LVALTPEARTKLTTYRNQQIDRWRARLAKWDTDDVITLTALLRRLAQAKD